MLDALMIEATQHATTPALHVSELTACTGSFSWKGLTPRIAASTVRWGCSARMRGRNHCASAGLRCMGHGACQDA
jgi:hypothetical protein